MKPATLVKLLVGVGSIVSGIIAHRAWSYFNPDVARFGWTPEIWIGVWSVNVRRQRDSDQALGSHLDDTLCRQLRRYGGPFLRRPMSDEVSLDQPVGASSDVERGNSRHDR
jgi:hypothetical protein